MPDVLTAIADIVNHKAFVLPASHSSASEKNRVNSSGEAFENYCKDRLSGVEPGDDLIRDERYKASLAYQGGANNPPDAMYRGGDAGDAFEFKKLGGGPSCEIHLNSSPPKDCLKVTSYGLAQECLECESWVRRDLFLICGGVKKASTKIDWLWIADARLMATSQEYYHTLHEKVRQGICAIGELSTSITKELGRINQVDPLNVSHLRIRAMWSIQSPGRLFAKVPGVCHGEKSVLHAILPTDKWDSMPRESQSRVEQLRSTPGFSMSDVLIENPNSPAERIPSRLIRYEKP